MIRARERDDSPLTREPDPDAFYTELFTEDPTWSTSYPNPEEARRAGAILLLLSEVALAHRGRTPKPLRILDLGCGRGWLTYMADAYGECLGVDPVAPVVEFARRRFPNLRFEVGTADDVLRRRDGDFDVVIASEVIEHVPPEDRERFVEGIRRLLADGGSAIITSDRGEFYDRWAGRGRQHQPIEVWLTEAQMRELFTGKGFVVLHHERVSWEQSSLSLLHRFVSSQWVFDVMTRMRQRWLLEGLRFLAAECQVWLFRLPT
jgi:SAM-dependent methyltransferase